MNLNIDDFFYVPCRVPVPGQGGWPVCAEEDRHDGTHRAFHSATDRFVTDTYWLWDEHDTDPRVERWTGQHWEPVLDVRLHLCGDRRWRNAGD